jgi:hypothetical protein
MDFRHGILVHSHRQLPRFSIILLLEKKSDGESNDKIAYLGTSCGTAQRCNALARSSGYGVIQGAFEYVSDLMTQARDQDSGVNIDTPAGDIGIRGTQFIVKSDGTPQSGN